MIKVGILGTGFMARAITIGAEFVDDLEITAVASRTQSKADEFSKAFRIESSFGSYAELIKSKSADIIYIATPAERHFQDIMVCIDNGKHVLCEKPLALNAEQVEQIAAAAAAKKLFVMEALWTRFIPAVRKSKDLIEAGKVGDIKLMTFEFHKRLEIKAQTATADSGTGVGALLDLGCYPLSLAQYFKGSPCTIVSATSRYSSGMDSQISAILSYEDGAMAQVSSGYLSDATRGVISGSKGKIEFLGPLYCPRGLRFTPANIEESAPAGPSGPPSGLKRALLGSSLAHRAKSLISESMDSSELLQLPIRGNGYNYELEEVVKCLNLGLQQSPIMPLSDSLESLKTIDSIVNSSRKEHP